MRRSVLAGLLLVSLVALGLVRASAAERFALDVAEPVAAVRVLAGRHVHGWDHNLPPGQMDEVAAKGRLRATCTYISRWAVHQLASVGVEARVVSTLTLDEWDDVNNGHTMLEARVDGRWVLFDVDRDVWFWRDGAPLDLPGYVAAVADGEYEIRPLSGDPVEDEATMRPDDRRLMQVPLVHDGGVAWFHSSDPERVLSYSDGYRELGEREWRERFYA